ncbi:MAG: hypothetical protein KY441_04940 [Actinobacteria bacterium]|nr:hypothetical protein [Actinomycetota bacterium]
MTPAPMCDVCGQPVPADEAVRAEMSVSQMMCPTSMTFHPACHARATALWQNDDTCTLAADVADYPEMAQWAVGRQGATGTGTGS